MWMDSFPTIIPVFTFKPMSPVLARLIENANMEFRADQLRGTESGQKAAAEPAANASGGLDTRI